MKSFSALKVLTQSAGHFNGSPNGKACSVEVSSCTCLLQEGPWLCGASLRQASRQFHALFKDFAHTLFAVPDIIPSTDKTEWEISDSSSDLCNIFVK